MTRYDEDRPPEDLTAWLAAGLRRSEALTWRRWNFHLGEALSWRRVGVPEALTAAQWQVAGVSPATVGDWIAANIGPGEAVRWHEFGFDLAKARVHKKNGRGPDDAFGENRRMSTRSVRGSASSSPMAQSAHAFHTAGAPPQVIHGYMEAQWTDEEAISWARQGIPAEAARIWQGIGLAPAEAGDLRKREITPVQVIQDWWRAGIPFDEVADWLGAGLTPAEAVEQRAAGVTVEQAAALRALRRGGAL